MCVAVIQVRCDLVSICKGSPVLLKQSYILLIGIKVLKLSGSFGSSRPSQYHSGGSKKQATELVGIEGRLI